MDNNKEIKEIILTIKCNRMKKLILMNSGSTGVVLDQESMSILPHHPVDLAIDYAYVVDEDMEITLEGTAPIKAVAGDIVLKMYSSIDYDSKRSLIVIKSEDLLSHIRDRANRKAERERVYEDNCEVSGTKHIG